MADSDLFGDIRIISLQLFRVMVEEASVAIIRNGGDGEAEGIVCEAG